MFNDARGKWDNMYFYPDEDQGILFLSMVFFLSRKGGTSRVSLSFCPVAEPRVYFSLLISAFPGSSGYLCLHFSGRNYKKYVLPDI